MADGRSLFAAAAAINRETETYSLWFKANGGGWRAWSTECRSPTKAATHRKECLERFPDAETFIVRRVEKREVLSPEREANLTWRPGRDA